MARGILAAGLTVVATGAWAQGPRGAGPDARTPAAGVLRIGMDASWTREPDRYENGVLHKLGDRFSFDSLGAGVIPLLQPIETAARTASGLPGFEASLGRTIVHARSTLESTPFSAEFGVTSHLAIGVVVPLVTSIARVDVTTNPLGQEATVGFNPALVTPAIADANGTLLGQLDAAAAFLSQKIATCAATPSASGCGPVNAGAASAQALLAESGAYASALATLYGGRHGSIGAPFIPIAGSAAQASVAARLAGIKAQYAAFGANQIVAAAPTGAPAPMTGSQFQTLLTDSAYGIRANPLASVVRRGVGDIDLSAQFTWHDSYSAASSDSSSVRRVWWRSAITGVYRLGTGASANPDDLIPVALGDHQNDVEVRSVTDIGFGERLSLTTSLRYTVQNPVNITVRVPTNVANVFPSADQTVATSVDPGDEFGVEFYPRWTASEAMSIAGYYGYRHRAADAYPIYIAPPVPLGTQEPPNPAMLGDGTEQREHRFGVSIAYSTVASWERGGARWPIEISFSHFQTTAGSGGIVPKLVHDDVQVRWYWRLFGRAGGTKRATGP